MGEKFCKWKKVEKLKFRKRGAESSADDDGSQVRSESESGLQQCSAAYRVWVGWSFIKAALGHC